MKRALLLLTLLFLFVNLPVSQAIGEEVPENLCLTFLSGGEVYSYADGETDMLQGLVIEPIANVFAFDADVLAATFLPNPQVSDQLLLVVQDQEAAEPLVIYAYGQVDAIEIRGMSLNQDGDLLFGSIDARDGDYDTHFIRRQLPVIAWISSEGIWPTWGPDSSTFAATQRDGRLAVFHMVDDFGGGNVPLTEYLGYGHHAQWSPDGETILYIQEGSIVFRDVESGLEQLLSLSDTYVQEARWLSDNQLLLIAQQGRRNGIYLTSVADGELSPLTRLWDTGPEIESLSIVRCFNQEAQNSA